MASADTTTDVLVRAGFEDVSLHRCDIEITIGADLDNAVEFVMALGPAGELIRLAGLQAEELRSNIVAALTEFQGADGSAIRAPASSWVVGARVRRRPATIGGLDLDAELAQVDERRSAPPSRVRRERQREGHPVGLAKRLAVAEDAIVPGSRLDREADGLEPADELTDVFPLSHGSSFALPAAVFS
jgi:hypothetical protein